MPSPHAVVAGLEAGGLGAHVALARRGAVTRLRGSGLRRIKSGLRHRPAAALISVLLLLGLRLPGLRIGEQFRGDRGRACGCRCALRRCLAEIGGRIDLLVLTGVPIPKVVRAVGVVVGNAAPPERVVVPRQEWHVDTEPPSPPAAAIEAPAPAVAAAPAIAVAAAPA